MKRLAKRILNTFGVDVVRFPQAELIYDLRSAYFNPYAVLYRMTNRDSILSELSLSDARDPFFCSYSSPSIHPYVQAVEYALNSSDRKARIFESIREFYDKYQPTSAAQFLGIEQFENTILGNIKPHQFVWPWEISTLERKARVEKSKGRPINLSKSKIGYDDLIGAGSWKHGGPATEERIINESLRIYNVLMSIMNRGYARHDRKDGDVVASILENCDGDWRWNISSGMHRAAVSSALGYSKIPVRIRGIVRQADVSVWPNVMNGLYSEAEAEQVFLNLFRAFRGADK